MNNKQFEVWAKKVFCGYSFGMLDETTYFDSDIDSAYIGWQACAELKQAELDKANARIAQLEEVIKSAFGDIESIYVEDKEEWNRYLSAKNKLTDAIAGSPDTWLSEHDKKVEVKVLNEAADSNSAGYVSEARLRKMAESR